MHPSIRQIDFAVQLGIDDLRLRVSLNYLLQENVRWLCRNPIGPCGLSIQLDRKVAQACVDVLINRISSQLFLYSRGACCLSEGQRVALLMTSTSLMERLNCLEFMNREQSKALYARFESVVIRWMSEVSAQYGVRILQANYSLPARQLEFLPLNHRTQISTANFVLKSHSYAFIALREIKAAPYLVHGYWPEELFTQTTGFLALWDYYPVSFEFVVPGDLMVVLYSLENNRVTHFSVCSGQGRFMGCWGKDLVNFPLDCLPLKFGDTALFYHKGTR